MDELRIGVAGLSGRGLHWVRLLQDLQGCRVTGLCDLYQGRIDQARELVGDAAEVVGFRDYDEFVRSDAFDAVALVVRCENQGAMAAQALEAGKHVHAEVPAAHSIEDCWRIVLAQERSGKVYQLAEQVRYAGYVEKWRQLAAQGELGRIAYAEGQYLHYYVDKSFYDPDSGEHFGPADLPRHEKAERAWLSRMPPIHYVVHDLSPLLKVLGDDRVVQVIGMSSDSPSDAHPELESPDIQVALMKTRNGVLLRLMASFSQPHPEDEMHWQQIIGTRGCVEWRRSASDRPRAWFADEREPGKREVDWGFERDDEPDEAKGSGHWNLDYYVHADFRDAVLERRPLELDVYGAMDIAAPSIIAAESIRRGGIPLAVPDFRPSAERALGQPLNMNPQPACKGASQ